MLEEVIKEMTSAIKENTEELKKLGASRDKAIEAISSKAPKTAEKTQEVVKEKTTTTKTAGAKRTTQDPMDKIKKKAGKVKDIRDVKVLLKDFYGMFKTKEDTLNGDAFVRLIFALLSDETGQELESIADLGKLDDVDSLRTFTTTLAEYDPEEDYVANEKEILEAEEGDDEEEEPPKKAKKSKKSKKVVEEEEVDDEDEDEDEEEDEEEEDEEEEYDDDEDEDDGEDEEEVKPAKKKKKTLRRR